MGRRAAARLTAIGAQVVAFGDRDSALHGGHIDGLPVLSPADIVAYHRGDAVLVASTMFDSAICEDLRARGCEAVVPVGYLNLRLPEVFKSREYEGACSAAADSSNRPAIEEAYALLGDQESRRVFVGKLAFYLSLDKERLDEIKAATTIYFDPSVYELGADEVVADGGAYVGDTLNSFLECCSGQFRSYFAFEPDGVSHARLAVVAATDPARITAVQAGLARHTTSARLLSTHGADSRVLGDDEPGGESVPVVSLDDYFEGRGVPSLIKMDIEGAEAEALLGATRMLRDLAPTLAVSAYHFPTDLWTVPLLIKRLMPRSRLYLRHYTREVDDTVCYAVPAHRLKS
jgi:FkbM family methyltransferase